MKNRTLAIFGIAAYIFSVITSATDLAGNPRLPEIAILASGILSFCFFVAAIIRLWKPTQYLTATFGASTVTLFALTAIVEFGHLISTPVILLLNLMKVVHFIALILVIAKLFKLNK